MASRPSAGASVRKPRVSRACVACQQKKQKCDGQTPACRNCLKANRSCISNDPSTHRQHPRGYLESLENHNALLEKHVAFLESKLKSLQPEVDINRITSRTDRAEEPSNSGAIGLDQDPSPQTQNNPTSSPSDDGIIHAPDDLSGLGILCLRAGGAEPHYFGASSTYSFTKLFSATLRGVRTQCPGLTTAGITDSLIKTRPSALPIQLPDRNLIGVLTNAYFEQVHPQFPFLHHPTYRQWEDDVLTAIEGGFSPEPMKAFFVYATAAVGALTGPLAGASLPEGLYASAEALFESVMVLNTLESIQAILCCAMYSLRSPVGVSLWTLSGLALRQCTELGLHRNIPWSKVESNYLKTQMRRRVFWCSYNLDRAVAITLGRPMGIADVDIDVEFPQDLDDEDITINGPLSEPRVLCSQAPTTVSAAIHTILLRRVWARIQGLVYPQTEQATPSQINLLVDSFKTELKDWLDNAPEQLPSNRANNNAFASPEWFKLMYHHSILLLHRQRLVSNDQISTRNATTSSSPSSSSTSPGSCSVYLECARSAEAICTIYRQLYMMQRLNDTWGALNVLFLGGMTFIHCLWADAVTRAHFRLDKVASICTSCMVVLAVMAERWEAVKPYRDAFDMLSTATQTMLAESDKVPVSSSTVGPVLSLTGQDQLTCYLSSMAEIGLCQSVEEILASMIA